MRKGFYDDNPAFVAAKAQIQDRITVASNACHDWLISNPGATQAPKELRMALCDAEKDWETLRRKELARYLRKELARYDAAYK